MGGPGDAGESTRAFRSDPEAVYAFVGRFFESLAAAGVAHVVISPGSRSTPLAISAERCRGLRTWIELDERAAAFFALGMGKATGRPAALVCTSGTAAANYLPAIVEAHHARVPLIALTADRPSELRDFGAGQTIEQSGLYGRHPRWSVEVPIAEAGAGALRHSEELAARAVEMDRSAGGAGAPELAAARAARSDTAFVRGAERRGGGVDPGRSRCTARLFSGGARRESRRRRAARRARGTL